MPRAREARSNPDARNFSRDSSATVARKRRKPNLEALHNAPSVSAFGAIREATSWARIIGGLPSI